MAISPELLIPSRYQQVLGSRMHYLEQGEGPVALFIHGNPTWSYQWRNVMPHVSPVARCVAMDCIGMGRSERPDLRFDFFDHARYLAAFVESLGLEDVILVTHDWGIALGAHYAQRYSGNVRGIALVCNGGLLVEGVLESVPSLESLPEGARWIFENYRDPATGPHLIQEENHFIDVVLRYGAGRELTEAEMAFYNEPYATPADRRLIRQWNLQVPIAGEPAAMVDTIDSLHSWLPTFAVPKLVLHASPSEGAEHQAIVEWFRTQVGPVTTRDVGAGGHYITEAQPDAIGRALAAWIRQV